MEVSASYAPHQHEAAHVNNTHVERMAAMKLGDCPGCGMHTHEISVVASCCGLRSRRRARR